MINLNRTNCIILTLSLLCNFAFAGESKSEKPEGKYFELDDSDYVLDNTADADIVNFIEISDNIEKPNSVLDNTADGDIVNLQYLAIRLKFDSSEYANYAATFIGKSGEITAKGRTIKYKIKDKKIDGVYLYLLFKKALTPDDIMTILSQTYRAGYATNYFAEKWSKYYIDGCVEMNGITLDNVPKKEFLQKRDWHDVVTVKETITRPELTDGQINFSSYP